ncbi:MAG: glycosyltransferase family 4 protein [Actinomycetales bacterium]|nr:glycosyltransferase family 4 protein [Actinomycetales bacterium]
MRIAMLTDCYLPRLGGIEVQVHDLATRLVAAGHDVEVFTATPGDGSAGVARRGTVDVVDGIPVHRLAIPLPRDLPVNPLAPLQLRSQLRRFDVAHIHMGVVSPFATDAAVLTSLLKIPTVMTWHCVLDKAAYAVRALGVVRLWARHGMAMNAVSDIAAAPLRTIVHGPPITVLPNGIDAAAWTVPTRPRPDDEVVRMVSAMRLAPRKRPLPLVEMAVKVRRAAPGKDVRLEILGEGPERPAVERLIARHQAATWITLPGRVTREELKARYAAADIYVSPTILESFGIAALEARTVGLPIVGRAGSGVAEFVADDVNGYLAESDDDMVRCLTSLVIHPGVRVRMRQHNQSVAPAQDWPTVVKLAESEYHRAINSRPLWAATPDLR